MEVLNFVGLGKGVYLMTLHFTPPPLMKNRWSSALWKLCAERFKGKTFTAVAGW